MKIKTKHRTYEEVMAMRRPAHKRPLTPSLMLGGLIRLISIPELWGTHFRFTTEDMEKAGDGPCLILMYHSSFIDLKIAYRILFPRRFSIVSTTDSFVGKAPLMRWLGCIPTKKFVSDPALISDMKFALHRRKVSVLMFPEAGYTFDGRATALPRRFGLLLKHLKVPVVTIITDGAFTYDPLYNALQKRKVEVSAHVKCILTPDEIAQKSCRELDEILAEAFSFDGFASQREQNVRITEPFRADRLHRILYQCPVCRAEGQTEGKGTVLTCHACGAAYELNEHGQLAPIGETKPAFAHIPDWFNWQREQVREEIISGRYCMDAEVEVGMMVDYRALYLIGRGRLVHTEDGFTLTDEAGKVLFHQSPLTAHTLNADFFWYEIGDTVCIGDNDRLFYCFLPSSVPVAKARLATEELYREKRRRRG